MLVILADCILDGFTVLGIDSVKVLTVAHTSDGLLLALVVFRETFPFVLSDLVSSNFTILRSLP